MKAIMVRKACSIRDWAETIEMMKYNGQKPTAVEVVIEKTITISKEEFLRFASDLQDDKRFIRENKSLMRVDEKQVWHCIKVRAIGIKQRILVESEGYDYARYVAVI